jgi:hypothetical protein
MFPLFSLSPEKRQEMPDEQLHRAVAESFLAGLEAARP